MRKLIPALAVAVAATVTAATVATAGTGTEHYSFIDTSTAAVAHPVFSVIATGAFTDSGTAIQESKATNKSKGVLVLHLSQGTITFHTGRKPAGGTKAETATACIQTETKHGNWTIAGGTGAYKGITGTGRVALVATFVETVSKGTCASGFSAVQAIVTASGPVTLP